MSEVVAPDGAGRRIVSILSADGVRCRSRRVEAEGIYLSRATAIAHNASAFIACEAGVLAMIDTT